MFNKSSDVEGLGVPPLEAELANEVARLLFDPQTYSGLESLGRVALSPSFHLREFLYSEIAVHYERRNVPDSGRLEFAVAAGRELCQRLLEPIQGRFGRVHIRSGYRSRAVNQLGVAKHNCAADNDGIHTWDYPTPGHGMGATACISVPSVSRAVLDGRVHELALFWWVLEHLPHWSLIEVFSTKPGSDEVAFNIGWHETPIKSFTSWRGGPRNVGKALPSHEVRQAAIQQLLQHCAQKS